MEVDTISTQLTPICKGNKYQYEKNAKIPEISDKCCKRGMQILHTHVHLHSK